MIKNWTVNTKQVKKGSKGLENHINYMKDERRPSHANTRIVVLNDSSKNIFKAMEDRTAYRQKEGLRGGGVRNYATSFVLSLPRDIKQPTDADWLRIGKCAISAIAKTNNIDIDVLKKHCNLIIHDESKGSKNSHLNICVSNVINNEVIKGISQRKTTYAVKNSLNYSVKKVLNEDNFKYIPKKEKHGKVPLWKAREEKANKVSSQMKKDAQRALKARNYIKRAKSYNERLMAQLGDINNSINEWVTNLIFNKCAEKEATKAAIKLDEVDLETPKKVLDIEETRKLKPKEKISSNRKRRRRPAYKPNHQ